VTAPAFWDGVGGEEARIHISDPIKVLTLGLAKPDTPVLEGKPGIIDLSKIPAGKMPAAIVLPASMEAATR
jgi:hypothetical protein